MATTAVALYDDATTAYAVFDELIRSGLREDEISVVVSEAETPAAGAPRGTSGPLGTGRIELGELTDKLGHLGVPRDEAGFYAEGVRRGGALVVVRASDADAERAAAIMEGRSVVDYQERSARWRETGWTGFAEGATPYTAEEAERERAAYRADVGSAQEVREGGEEVVPVMEERLDVGKRAVERGRARIHTHVEERPVEETVRLRDERVHVERRRVDRPVTASEDAFRERTIEVSETAEEAVVEKEARVVEEVVVSKDAVEHEETVRDTVRRTEVEVEDTTTGQRTGGPRRDRT
jgi:uncharacterized protein (TIGR02271 family)